MRDVECDRILKYTFPDDSRSPDLAFIRGTLRPALRPGFSVIKHRVWMGKWGIQHCEACLLPLLSMPRS